MNWQAAVEICIDVLQNPRANVGEIICAKESLRELARNAAELKAHVGQLQEALDEAPGKEDTQ
jgi:hypothetical protein